MVNRVRHVVAVLCAAMVGFIAFAAADNYQLEIPMPIRALRQWMNDSFRVAANLRELHFTYRTDLDLTDPKIQTLCDQSAHGQRFHKHGALGFSLGYGDFAFIETVTGPHNGTPYGRIAFVRGIMLVLPTVVAVPLLLAFPILFWRRIYRSRRRSQTGCCAACGYDLRASPAMCPECGNAHRCS